MPREIMGITIYTAEETAGVLGVTKRTLLSYIKAGKITGSKIKGHWAFTQENIRAFVTQGSAVSKKQPEASRKQQDDEQSEEKL